MFSIRAKTDTCQADYNPVLENTNHRMDEGPSLVTTNAVFNLKIIFVPTNGSQVRQFVF